MLFYTDISKTSTNGATYTGMMLNNDKDLYIMLKEPVSLGLPYS